MSENFKELVKLGLIITNTPIYENWSDKFKIEELNKRKEYVKTQLKGKLNGEYFKELSYTELNLLGFKAWTLENQQLIPFWIYEILDDDVDLYCPLSEEYMCKKYADNDERMGCVAFMFKEFVDGY